MFTFKSFTCLLLLTLFASCGVQKKIPLQTEAYTFENAKGEKIPAEMGSFFVPENRSKPDGKKLELKFVRFKSTNPNPGSPIVYLAGGPGGSGINAAKYNRYELFMSLRAVADVIAFDQRGTGLSDAPPPYAAYWRAPDDQLMTLETMEPIIREATRKATAYFEEQDVDLKGYNTNESADDLNDLRIALGANKISLWAISYGTHLALTTLKRHEKRLDKLILAGVESYDQTVKMPIDQQQLLEKIDGLLKADSRTKNVFPDFLGDVQKLLVQLETKPEKITVKNIFTQADTEIVFGKMDAQRFLAASLRGPDDFKGVPLAVSQMLNGDFSAVAEYAYYFRLGGYRGMSTAMDVASVISP